MMSDSRSAGETPAAPPDPWKGIQVYEDPADGCPMVQWEEVQAALATERQHHAEALGKARLVANTAMRVADERTASADADLTAARAEIARLTEELSEGTKRAAARLEVQEWDAIKAHDRAEAAEASLLALRAAHAQLREERDTWERRARVTLWLNHGCSGMYGDDGEMQCARMTAHPGVWDFKRTPWDDIQRALLTGKWALASSPPHPETEGQ